ncbi:MAG: c-type cytochrome [Verrucomicrobiae bacterium]|nr:c-type cytochrome [Verrucomicrobiae bacterium]
MIGGMTSETFRSPRLGIAVFLTIAAAAAISPGYEKIEDVPKNFKMPAPLPLKESVASIEVSPGLRVELIAAEPLVMDPIAIDWGPDGRLWVVEMADYPLGIDGKGTPGGRVRFLEDRDGDGKYESSTLFLDGLNYPTGVKAWHDGVLVVAAPEILFAKDTDGDGRADVREVLYRGFREGNQQHRVNGLVWSLDGWLYLANGDSAGTVESVKTGEKAELGAFDLKIRPETGEMALVTGRTQFGRARDDFDNWFGCSNSRPLFTFALDRDALRRNPHAVYPPATLQTADDAFAPPIFPVGVKAHRFNDPFAESRFTSACGLTIHRDPRLGAAFAGNAIVCEPVHNLVHREILGRHGATFRSHRAPDEADREFLRSTDQWFRPVSARTGPDGAIWIVDMHRYVIEHPEWIPETWQKVLDLRAGEDRGRVYRIVSDACAASAVPERLDTLDDAALAARLDSPNGWTRDMAQQLLLWRGAAPQNVWTQQGLVGDSTLLGRVHRLHLFGKGRVPDAILESVLADPAPELRAQGIRLAGPGQAAQAIARLASDADPAVRFQAALALGDTDDPAAGEALATLALADSEDPTMLAAAMSSALPHLEPLAKAVAAAPAAKRKPLLPCLFETAIGAGDGKALATLLADAGRPPTERFETFAAFLQVLDRRKLSLDAFRAKFSGLTAILDGTRDLTDRATALVGDAKAPEADRLAAVSLLGRRGAGIEADRATLLALLRPETGPGLQRAALNRLLDLNALPEVLAAWPSLTPGPRSTLIDRCLSEPNLAIPLLDAIDRKSIAVREIDSASRDRLLRYPNGNIRTRARELLAGAVNPDREAAIRQFEPALSLEGDAAKGREVFQLTCAVCHRLDGIGQDLGADLAALADKSGPSLLAAILDPNRAVEEKFVLYAVTLRGGETLAGLVAEESGDSLTLRLLDGTERRLLRGEIAGIESTGRSAMPEGLEAALDPAKLADLIAFLRSAR